MPQPARRRFLLLLSTMALVAVSPLAPATDDATRLAIEPVDAFQDGMIDALRDADALGFDGRRQAFEDLVRSHFDIAGIEARVMAPIESELNDDQRKRLGALLLRYATSQLALQFDRFEDQVFEPLGTRQLAPDRVRVRSRFSAAGKPVGNIAFDVRRIDDRWFIADFRLSGVSGVRIQRREFSAVVAAHGGEGLLERLHERVQRMRTAALARR